MLPLLLFRRDVLRGDRPGKARYLIYFLALGAGLGCWSKSPLKRGFLSTLIVGAIVGLIFVLESGLIVGLTFGLLVGLIGGLIGGVGVGSLEVVSPVETLRWQWNQFWRKAIQGSKIGLLVGLLVGLFVGLIYKLSEGLIVGLILVLIGGLVGGLLGVMTDTVKFDKASPNQGITLSLKNALFLLPIFGLIFVLIFELSVVLYVGLHLELREELIGGLIFGLSVAPIFGLIGALNRGGSAVVKHYSLRLIIWIKCYTPFKLIKFLDHCAKLILLKKVGGGYMFIHRMLLEHFAKMKVESAKVKKPN